LLNVGLVGAITYVSFLSLGIKKVFSYYKKTGSAGYGFLFMLLVFAAIHGLFEGDATSMSFVTFLLICGFLHLSSSVPVSSHTV